MKKLLVCILVLSLIFVFGCKKQETTDASSEDVVKTEESVEKQEPEKKKEENKEPVNTENIKKAEDIDTMDELSALIDESNDPKTSPERKEELLEIVGEYLEEMAVESVELTK